MSGPVENFNIRIYPKDTVNVINVRLCVMVLLIELYLFIPLLLSVTVTVVSIVLTENFVFLSG